MTDTTTDRTPGSHDGKGAADHDMAYQFGHHLSSGDFHPFKLQDFTRLTILRSRVQEDQDQNDLVGEPLSHEPFRCPACDTGAFEGHVCQCPSWKPGVDYIHDVTCPCRIT